MEDLNRFMLELEQFGLSNDVQQTDKKQKFLNITRDTGEFLAVLIKACKAATALELGTSNGYSTIWLATALPDNGYVTTLENDPVKAKQAQENFNALGLERKITLFLGDLCDTLNDIEGEQDFIFLDADRGLYLDIAPLLFSKLEAGGLLVCDNAVSHADELDDFTKWVAQQPNLSTALVPVGKGELLVYKNY